MPPSELINVRNFRDKYAGLIRGQKDHNFFNAQSEWSPELREEVAQRCQIADDLSFSNAAFVNPTLFHMLRQHREFNDATERELLEKKRNVAASMERKRHQKIGEIESAAESWDEMSGGQAGTRQKPDLSQGQATATKEDIEQAHAVHGEQGELLLNTGADELSSQSAIAQSMDVDNSTIEDALARLASAEQNGQSMPSSRPEGVVRSAKAVVSADIDESGDASSSSESNSSDVANSDNENDDDSSSSDSEDTDSEISLAKQTSASHISGRYTPLPITPLVRNFEEVTLVTPQSELPEGITQEMLKKAIANSGFARSTDIEIETRQVPKQRVRIEEPAGVSELENKFRNVKKLLDESTLASLRKANRRMIPPKYRLEVNFMTNRVQSGAIPDATPVADDEVILSVCFYNTRSTNSKMEEYQVLGSQSLTVLRDAFYCISDFLVSHRDETIENTKDKKVSSGYFFIENTFYNDMRSPNATDYSRVIMEWANDPERQEKNPKLQGLQSRLMDGARFLDLSIRLKQPYMFVHQGDCEHVMIFTDLRLLGPKDDQFVECYPKQIFRTRHMRHKCRMCSAYPAQYVTKNDFHSGMSPCYFCEKCYTPFHFDKDGNKLLEHDVFPYANVNLM
ncbi:hypothetical protein FB639_000660 [Coemansia asiatica]|nr:hypothetical protein FB639_000660 [Coemansia asiatica]